MATSTPRLGVDHPTVVPTDFRREDDAEEEPAAETPTDEGDERGPTAPSA
ncbi:hypothetical protein [Halobellus sp. GM3]